MPEPKCYAMMSCGIIHTLKPSPYRAGPAREFRWQAFRDGVAWRLFKTVKDWRREAEMDRPGPYVEPGQQQMAAYRAEVWAAHEASMLLAKLQSAAQKD